MIFRFIKNTSAFISLYLLIWYMMLEFFSIYVISRWIESFDYGYKIDFQWTLYGVFIAPLANRIAGIIAHISGNSSEWLVFVPGAIILTIGFYILFIFSLIYKIRFLKAKLFNYVSVLIFANGSKSKSLLFNSNKKMRDFRFTGFLYAMCTISYFIFLSIVTFYSCRNIFEFISPHSNYVQKNIILFIFSPSFIIVYPIWLNLKELDFCSLIQPIILINFMLFFDGFIFYFLRYLLRNSSKSVITVPIKYLPFCTNIKLLSMYIMCKYFANQRAKNV